MTIFILVTVTLCLAVGVAVAAGVRLRPNPGHAMRVFSERYEGKLTQTKNPAQTTVSFELGGQAAMLRLKPPVGYANQQYTEFRTTWAEPRLRLQVQPRNTLRPDFFYDESPTIDSGDPDFDARYRFYAEQPELARRLVTAGVFSALDPLNDMTRPGAAYLEIHDGYLFVTLEKTFGDSAQLEEVVAYCREFLLPSSQVATDDATPRPHSATHAPAEPSMRNVCNACGDVVQADGLACADCGAIYHRDCWNPKVGCVLYACEGKEAALIE
ncbi:MAG: hypothetical protein ACIALR_09790 [Blastopirellula sp. JB062]